MTTTSMPRCAANVPAASTVASHSETRRLAKGGELVVEAEQVAEQLPLIWPMIEAMTSEQAFLLFKVVEVASHYSAPPRLRDGYALSCASARGPVRLLQGSAPVPAAG